MNPRTAQRIKSALISILIGAIVTFITVFLEGTVEFLNQLENNGIGASAGAASYFIKNFPF